jgi:putative aldouronate transport system substrate-binding protein
LPVEFPILGLVQGRYFFTEENQMNKLRALPLFLVCAFLALPAFAGGQKGEVPGNAPTVSGTDTGPFSYPVRPGGKLIYWEQPQAIWSANYPNFGQSPMGKGLMERTGIEIEFQHPPAAAIRESFNLMVADGNFPDIIQYNFHTSYSGGPSKALDDGIIIPLNDVIDKYAPNLKAYLKANPDIDRMVKTDDGRYYTFPFVRGHERLLFSSGTIIRKDWLDDLGLPLPTTLDEIHTVLVAFRDKKGAAAPYTAEGGGTGNFLYAFGQEGGFYVDSAGKIRHGVIEPGYKTYIQTMAQWYKEGLLDPDLFTQNFETVSAKMTSGTSGMSSGSVNSRMITWNSSARKTNPGFTLVMIAAPVLKKGDKPEFATADLPYGTNTNSMTGISTDCKNIELAARLLDYGYSVEGGLYYNFGTEGVSYTMVNGFPTFTPFITNNPQGLPISQALGGYALSGSGGPFVQDVRYLEQYMNSKEGKEAVDTIYTPPALKHKVPIISLTPAENQELARIMNEANTYITEMTTRYILGVEPLSSYDNFVSTIRRMGIERAIEIENAALERYNKR